LKVGGGARKAKTRARSEVSWEAGPKGNNVVGRGESQRCRERTWSRPAEVDVNSNPKGRVEEEEDAGTRGNRAVRFLGRGKLRGPGKEKKNRNQASSSVRKTRRDGGQAQHLGEERRVKNKREEGKGAGDVRRPTRPAN